MSFELRKLEDVCDILDHMRIPITSRDRKAGPYPYYGANGIQDYIDDYIFDDELVLLAEDGGNFGSKEKPIAYRISGKTWVNNHAHVLKPKNIIDVDYLCYSLMYYDVSGLVNGATRQKLTQSEMRKINIRYRRLEKQRQIVFKIKLISNIISSRKHQLCNLDSLVKSRFVELFLQANESFPKKKLGECTVINPKKSMDTRLKEDLIVSFVPMASVGEDGSIDTSEKKLYREVKSGFTYFIEGDVLFAKITPCMENGKGAVAINLYNGIGFGSTEFHVIRPLEGFTNPVWLYNLSVSKKFRLEAEANMTGSAGQKRTPASFLQNYEIKLPPIELQNQFADFAEQVDKSKFVVTAKFQ